MIRCFSALACGANIDAAFRDAGNGTLGMASTGCEISLSRDDFQDFLRIIRLRIKSNQPQRTHNPLRQRRQCVLWSFERVSLCLFKPW
jgi:hypothetical protein